MEILLASGHLPSPRGTQGGSKTSYHLSRCFSRRHNVHLVSFATANELATHDAADMNVYHCWDILPVDNWMRLRGVLSTPRLPVAVAARRSSEYRKRLRRILTTHHFDMVILDHTALFQYFADVSHIPIVVGCAHDVTTQNWQRRAEAARNLISNFLLSFEYDRMRRWEAERLERLHLILPHSEKDALLAKLIQPKAQVFAIQPWITRWDAHEALNRVSTPLPNSIVFWGAMDRQENIDAASFIAFEILPQIHRVIPEAKLYIAGNHGKELAARFESCRNVEIVGYVAEPAAFLSQMQVALLPLRFGAGIKVKTLECMSAGVPVVTTDMGAEGVGASAGMHYLLGNSVRELVEHTTRLLRQPPEALSIGRSGQEFVYREYDFDRRIAALERHLEALLSRTGRHDCRAQTVPQHCPN